MTSKKLIEKIKHIGVEEWRIAIEKIEKDLDRLEKLEKVIEILKRMCIFEFEEETIYKQDEWADCYVIYVTQFNNGFNKEEYDLLKEVLDGVVGGKRETMKKNYFITLIGCDDITRFQMELSNEELELVKKLCQKSEETSEYVCMPTMEVEEDKSE